LPAAPLSAPGSANNAITPPTPLSTQPPCRGRPAKFSSRELEELARVTIEENPFGAKHREKGAALKVIVRRLRADGFFTKSSVDTIKNKMVALLAYQEVTGYSLPVRCPAQLASRSQLFWIGFLILIQRTAATQNDEQKKKVHEVSSLSTVVFYLSTDVSIYRKWNTILLVVMAFTPTP
jgi:hypothetical protein